MLKTSCLFSRFNYEDKGECDKSSSVDDRVTIFHFNETVACEFKMRVSHRERTRTVSIRRRHVQKEVCTYKRHVMFNENGRTT